MANGNTDLIREMKRMIEEGKPLDVNTRDRLLFSAIIDIYEKQEESVKEAVLAREELMKKITPVLVFYQVGMYFASAIGLAVLGVIGALLTGRIEFVMVK